jgi:hypothetical protein
MPHQGYGKQEFIFIGQIKQFKIGDAWITGEPLMIMLAIIAATMAIIYFLPKFSKVVLFRIKSIIDSWSLCISELFTVEISKHTNKSSISVLIY